MLKDGSFFGYGYLKWHGISIFHTVFTFLFKLLWREECLEFPVYVLVSFFHVKLGKLIVQEYPCPSSPPKDTHIFLIATIIHIRVLCTFKSLLQSKCVCDCEKISEILCNKLIALFLIALILTLQIQLKCMLPALATNMYLIPRQFPWEYS